MNNVFLITFRSWMSSILEDLLDYVKKLKEKGLLSRYSETNTVQEDLDKSCVTTLFGLLVLYRAVFRAFG